MCANQKRFNKLLSTAQLYLLSAQLTEDKLPLLSTIDLLFISSPSVSGELLNAVNRSTMTAGRMDRAVKQLCDQRRSG